MSDSQWCLGRNSQPRAQSETIGIVLVFAMVIAGAVVVVAFGAGAVSDSQESLANQRAEKTMTQLDSRAALVALGNTDTQSVSFSQRSGESFAVDNGSGWMNVTIENTSLPTGDPDRWDNVTQRLGAVTYENGAGEIGYQGGGVWRSSGEGSVMVSPPEFHFRNGTLTLPIVNVTGDATLHGGAGLTHEETVTEFPSGPDRVNPLDQHLVRIEVQSQYYEAWGRYFEERTDGVVEYDHDENRAELELVSPFGMRSMDSAVAGLGSGGTFTLHGSAVNNCGKDVTDSYDSSNGPYCSGSNGEEGDIVYAGDVDISSGSGNSDIHGNLVGGRDVRVGSGGGQPAVYGHINYTDDCLDSLSECDDVIEGAGHSRNQISGVETIGSIDYYIDNRYDDVSSNNDNSGATNISGSSIDYAADGPSDHATLDDGSYFLERIDFSGGDELTLDTTDGDVTLVVEEYVDVGSNEINVDGENAAKIFVVGDHGGTWDLDIGDGGEVTVPGDNATRVRLYGRSDFQMRMDGSGGGNVARFVGIVYAPPGGSGTSYLEMNHAELFGGVINADTDVGNNGGGGSIHYDEALQGRQIISRDAHVVKVTYLHVTINRIHVASD